MKILRYNDYFKINELFVHKEGDDPNDKYFINYKQDLWIFDDEEYEEKEIYKIINDKLGDDILTEDIYDSIQKIEEEYPYILTGKIYDNYIIISNINYRHGQYSKDLKKVSQYLKLPVRISYQTGSYLDIDHEYDLEYFEEIKDGYFYHGTCLKYLDGISVKGIIPNDNTTNFDNIIHKDKIFITANLDKALFHANTAALNQNSFPIILKFKIPDISKLVLDYDLGLVFYGTDADVNKKLGYSNIHKGTGGIIHNTSILKDSEKIDISKKLGIYGYTGRIPASFIDDILIDIQTLSNHWYDFNLDTLDYDSDMWNNFNSVEFWSELSIKDTLKRVEQIEDNFESEMSDEDDNNY